MNPAELYENEANMSQGDDGKWYYTPDKFVPKLLFLIGSVLIVILGIVLGWDPATRWAFGERSDAHVTRIVREEPDQDPEIIRYRKTIPEGDHLTRFTYTVGVEQESGQTKEMTLAVGSRRNTFANVNDSMEVVYFQDEDHAYQLFEHRTWAFGIGFFVIGAILTACAIPTLYAVGKPILIDPEAAEPTDKEGPEGVTP